jgi:hypothetical protein
MGALEDANALVGRELLGLDGHKIDRITAIFVDAASGEPEWAMLGKGGLLGTKFLFVPLDKITVEGKDVVVAFDKKHVKNAPRAQTEGVISPAEKTQLWSHYGMDRGPAVSGSKDATLIRS